MCSGFFSHLGMAQTRAPAWQESEQMARGPPQWFQCLNDTHCSKASLGHGTSWAFWAARSAWEPQMLTTLYHRFYTTWKNRWRSSRKAFQMRRNSAANTSPQHLQILLHDTGHLATAGNWVWGDTMRLSHSCGFGSKNRIPKKNHWSKLRTNKPKRHGWGSEFQSVLLSQTYTQLTQLTYLVTSAPYQTAVLGQGTCCALLAMSSSLEQLVSFVQEAHGGSPAPKGEKNTSAETALLF